MTKQKEQKKQIELPNSTIRILDRLAEGERMSTKAYMEKVLIDHADAKVKNGNSKK